MRLPRRTLLPASLALAACAAAGDAESTPAGIPLRAGVEDDGDPAVVALVQADEEPPRLRCTGTLLAPHVVLTAAHCGVHVEPTRFAVQAGPARASRRSRRGTCCSRPIRRSLATATRAARCSSRARTANGSPR